MTDQSGDDARRFDTVAVAHGEGADAPTGEAGDVAMPIHVASTFRLDGIDPDASLDDVSPDRGEFLYTRLSNPTRHALERRLAALEGGEHGFAFASGTAAIATTALASVRPGDHVVACDDLYGGTNRLLAELFEGRLGVDVSLVDATDPANVADAMRPETTLVWMESPTNPLLKLCDLAAISEIADEHDAVFGVDNTFCSPYNQRPLDLGVDVVVHSTTKYLNGHSDSLGGVAVTSDDALAEELAFLQQVGVGAVLSPFDSFMVLRGTKTLPARMDRHETNARRVAEFLDGHDRVAAVHYPGLSSHPQHDLARRQQSGFGGVLSVELDGDVADVQRFVAGLDEFTLAVSLGGVESLVEHPASMTHSPLSQAERDHLGITDSLLRLSVGIEHPDDLVEDLATALDAVG